MHLPPARTIPIAVTTTDVLLINGAGILTFYNFTETTGSATAAVQLFDGTDDGGALLTDVTLLANESTRDPIPTPCVAFRNALFLEVLSGSVKGAVWVIPGEQVNAYMTMQGVDPIWLGAE